MYAAKIMTVSFFLLLVVFDYSYGQNYIVSITDAIEIAQGAVQLRWTVTPTMSLAYIKALHSSDNWQTSIEIPIEFILASADNSALIANSPFDMMNYYKVSACDVDGICSAYSDSSKPIDTKIKMKLTTMKTLDNAIMLNWEQTTSYKHPISGMKLEVAVNSDQYTELPGSSEFFDSNLYFIQNRLYSKDLSNYTNTQYPSADNAENLRICQQWALSLGKDYYVFLQSTVDKRCYFNNFLIPFFVTSITDLNDIAGFLAVNASSFNYQNTLIPDGRYTFRLSYTTVYNTRGSFSTTFKAQGRFQPPNDSNNSLAIAIAVPIACVIFLIIVAVSVLITYRFIRFGSPFGSNRNTNPKRSKLYENSEMIN